MKLTPSELPTCRIAWIDAETKGSAKWQSCKDMMKWAKEPMPVMDSVGYVVFECDEHIVLCADIAGTDCGTATKIPKAWIVRRVSLEETK